MHGTTTEITVYSNHPGMQCASCQSKGYPWTDGVDRTLYNKPAPPIDSTAPEPEYITVLLRDATGFEVAVKMLSSGHLGYAMEQYARTACREANLCRFLLEGERVTKTETPKQVSTDSAFSTVLSMCG